MSAAAGALVAIIGVLLAAGPGLAQSRPTLSETESRVGVLESEVQALESQVQTLQASHCAAWDLLDGSLSDPFDVRPLFCPASCGCQFNATGVESCVEESPGEFVATKTSGTCSEILAECVGDGYCDVPPGGGVCADSDDCPAGESCVGFAGLCSVSGAPCNSWNAPCPMGESCPAAAFVCRKPCTSSLECGTGEGLCTSGPSVGSSCQDDTECEWLEELVRLTGIGPPGSTSPVTCEPSIFTGGPEVMLNNNDALTCLAIVETELGQTCTPAP